MGNSSSVMAMSRSLGSSSQLILQAKIMPWRETLALIQHNPLIIYSHGLFSSTVLIIYPEDILHHDRQLFIFLQVWLAFLQSSLVLLCIRVTFLGHQLFHRFHFLMCEPFHLCTTVNSMCFVQIQSNWKKNKKHSSCKTYQVFFSVSL